MSVTPSAPKRVPNKSSIEENGTWVLLAAVESNTSFKTGGTKNASPEETQIMDSLLGADGYAYNKSSSTSAVTIRRLNCKTCHVQIKFERGNLRIAKYQKGAHNHLPPPVVAYWRKSCIFLTAVSVCGYKHHGCRFK